MTKTFEKLDRLDSVIAKGTETINSAKVSRKETIDPSKLSNPTDAYLASLRLAVEILSEIDTVHVKALSVETDHQGNKFDRKDYSFRLTSLSKKITNCQLSRLEREVLYESEGDSNKGTGKSLKQLLTLPSQLSLVSSSQQAGHWNSNPLFRDHWDPRIDTLLESSAKLCTMFADLTNLDIIYDNKSTLKLWTKRNDAVQGMYKWRNQKEHFSKDVKNLLARTKDAKELVQKSQSPRHEPNAHTVTLLDALSGSLQAFLDVRQPSQDLHSKKVNAHEEIEEDDGVP